MGRQNLSSARSGIALLLVLATVVLLLVALAGGVQALQLSRQAVAVRGVHDHLTDGLAAGELAATLWLRHNVNELVLPPEGGGITIVNDRLAVRNGNAVVNVRLFDELALLPGHLVAPEAPLRSALPAGWSTLVVPTIPRERWEQPSDLLETLAVGGGRARFPQPVFEHSWRWRDPAEGLRAPEAVAGARLQRTLSLAEVIGCRSIPRLNVNTASESVLRAAATFLKVSRGVVDGWCQRRRKGLFVGAPEALSRDPNYPLLLVESSDAWNALITVEWNGVRRSWWVVIAGNARSFWIVQRHDASR